MSVIAYPPLQPYERTPLAALQQELGQWEWLLDAANGERWDDHRGIMAHRDQCAAELARRQSAGRAT
jgi:hypothetical protein